MNEGLGSIEIQPTIQHLDSITVRFSIEFVWNNLHERMNYTILFVIWFNDGLENLPFTNNFLKKNVQKSLQMKKKMKLMNASISEGCEDYSETFNIIDYYFIYKILLSHCSFPYSSETTYSAEILWSFWVGHIFFIPLSDKSCRLSQVFIHDIFLISFCYYVSLGYTFNPEFLPFHHKPLFFKSQFSIIIIFHPTDDR